MPRINVISPDGVSGTMPIDRWSQEAVDAGYKLVDPDQRMQVTNPDGVSGTIPMSNLIGATQAGYTFNKEKQYSTGNKAASMAKSVVAGVGGAIPDTAALAYNLPAMGINAMARGAEKMPSMPMPNNIGGEFLNVPDTDTDSYNSKPPETPQLPLIPSATEAIDRGIDSATGGYTETPPGKMKSINEGIKFASGVAGGGGIAKLASSAGKTGLAKLGNVAGSTSKTQQVGAGAAGYTMSELEDSGAGTAGSLAGGAAAGLGVGNFKNIAKSAAGGAGKVTAKITGLDKKNLNLEAAKAARDLEINLPKAVASDGKMIAYADRFLSNAPLAGNIMKDRYAKIGNKILGELEKSYDSILPKKQLEGIEKKIDDMFSMSEKLMPEGGTIVPKNTVEEIGKVRKKIEAPDLSGDFKKINTTINNMEKGFSPSGIKGIPAEAQILLNQKRNLNNAYADLKTPEGRRYLTQLNNSVRKDIEQFGKQHPEWYSYFSKADDLFATKARREELVKMLATKAESPTHGEMTVGNLSKTLNSPNSRDRLKEIVEPEIFTRLEKLGSVTQAFAKKSKNTINPSGTAVAQTTINWLSAIAGYGTDSLATGGLSVLGAAGVAHLLTDKKTLDLAIKLAETPTEKAAVSLNRRIKSITGYTPVTLAALKESSSKEQEKQEKNGKGLRAKINNHFEENKKRKPGQGLKKLLSNPTVGKIGRALNDNPWKRNR